MMIQSLLLGLLSIVFGSGESVADREIIYGRRDGMALTMTVLTPQNSNGKAIVSILSSGWHSDHAWFPTYKDRAIPFVEAGYTVFLTEHSSAPRYAIPDALHDVQTAVQFVRLHSADFGIDPKRIGVTGTSSGGHLALLLAMSEDIMQPDSKDLLLRTSSKVQAAAVFCAPTDFLNYGKPNNLLRNEKNLLQQLGVSDCFRYTEYDQKQNTFAIVDESMTRLTDSLMSPAQIITPDDAPVYISHGDKDDIVPLQQAKAMIDGLTGSKIPAELSVKRDAGHGWKNMNADEKAFVSWFDRHLK